MNKKVLVISSSPRKGGNSDVLADRFCDGAVAGGNVAEKVRLSEKSIAYCTGCGYCNTSGKCVQKDDMAKLGEKMIEADVIVLATPVYFYAMCGQLKTFIDRSCPFYLKLQGKKFYYILTAADGEESSLKKVVEELRGFTIDCVPNAVEGGTIYGVGVWQKGEIEGTKAYSLAYESGRNC